VSGSPEEIKAALILEERARRIIQGALGDEQLMNDVLEASKQEASGEAGAPWPEVKARLGLV
jgi:hypothetical protein